MLCEYCLKEHDGTYGSGRFCNKGCSCGFSTKNKRLEINKKISARLTGRKCPGSGFKKGYDSNRRVGAIGVKLRAKMQEKKVSKIRSRSWNTCSRREKRRRILVEQNESCNKCKLSKWLDEKITLELEHKDGVNTNNARENVELLCPNCHSYTKTWRGRNIKKQVTGREKVSDSDLSEQLKTNNIRQALINVGLAPAGANYKRAERLKSAL